MASGKLDVRSGLGRCLCPAPSPAIVTRTLEPESLASLCDLTASQRAVVGFDLQPRIADDVNRKRIEKIRQARLNEGGGQTLSKMSRSADAGDGAVSSRAIAADIMGVSEGYIHLAKRVKEASPELFESVRSGHITLSEAIKQIDGLTDDARATRVKTVRRLLNRLLGDDDESSEFLDRLEALVAEFSRR